MAGAILLIVASAAALLIGWTSTSSSLLWASIAASVLAGVCMSLALYKSRNP